MNVNQTKKLGCMLGKKLAEYRAKRSKELVKVKARTASTKKKLEADLKEARALAVAFQQGVNAGLKQKPKVAKKKKVKKKK